MRGPARTAALFGMLVMAAVPPACAEELTGDYQIILNQQTQRSIAYRCNSLDVYVNSGGILSGDLTCNTLKLSANGGSRVAFQGSVPSVHVHLVNGGSKVYLNELAIQVLHVETANDRSVSYFKVSQSAQVDLVNGEAILYIRAAENGSTMPNVHIHQINGYGEVHWCGVRAQADTLNGGGQMMEDCNW